jgi:polysaccharide export outer membrane protein
MTTAKNLILCACLVWSLTSLLAQTSAPVQASLPGQTSPPKSGFSTNDPHSFAFSERNPRYELRPGDGVELGFEFSPEFNQTATVQPDGFMNLRGIGDVHVAGLTVPEFTRTLNSEYGTILKQPVITVVLKDFEKPYFIASGQVTKPGKYELRGDTNLTEAVAMAGGFNDMAKHSKVVLFRRVSPGQFEAKVFDLKKMMNEKNLQEDAYLRPGDMIYVPQSNYSKIRRYIPAPGLGMYLTPSF